MAYLTSLPNARHAALRFTTARAPCRPRSYRPLQRPLVGMTAPSYLRRISAFYLRRISAFLVAAQAQREVGVDGDDPGGRWQAFLVLTA